jgi:hypothetical protein
MNYQDVRVLFDCPFVYLQWWMFCQRWCSSGGTRPISESNAINRKNPFVVVLRMDGSW